MQCLHLLHQQFTKPDFDIANTSNWLLQLPVTQQSKRQYQRLDLPLLTNPFFDWH